MGPEPVTGLVIFSLLTAAWLVFATIELAGLDLPGFHTISYLAYHHQSVRIAILLAIFAFAAWWWIHSGHPVAK